MTVSTECYSRLLFLFPHTDPVSNLPVKVYFVLQMLPIHGSQELESKCYLAIKYTKGRLNNYEQAEARTKKYSPGIEEFILVSI